jgi:phenylalanyl-tRNA synthetase beta chain
VKITVGWLKQFVSVESDVASLARHLTLAGLEIESIEPVAPPFTGVVVGEVLETARHPDADKLSVCQVTTDGTNRLQIVCGAGNVRKGLKVAVALVGAELPHDVKIKRVQLRGIESAGMLCSARELGLGDGHEGIMELPPELPLHRNLRAALDLDDTVLEIKATPNRGDCMSVFGIARDYTAAQLRRYLHYSVPPIPAANGAHQAVHIAAAAACPVFAGRVIRGLRPGAAAPFWMRERLRRVGINSISAVVDVTNYVMIELGQPMHAYDLGRLSGSISVRAAMAGEPITLLDDKTYALDTDFTVVADASGPIGLAGIMGGRGTAITGTTVDVYLEAAHWVPAAIAGRARRLGLFTDAAQRFERGVDPTLPARAIERATALILEAAGGEPGPVSLTTPELSIDATPADETAEPETAWVKLRRARLTRLLGVSVPDIEAHALLGAISEHVEVTTEGWRLRPPPHRFDLTLEADLIEEVARLRGFDRIPEIAAITPQVAGRAIETQIGNDRLLLAMIDRGYREAITYSFVDPQAQRRLFPAEKALALENPLSPELSEMRVSLWPGLLKACRDNVHRQHLRVRLFEIGKRFELHGSDLAEVESLGAVAIGARWPEQWGSAATAVDFFDMKADLEAVFELTGDLDGVRFEAEQRDCLHPGRCARIYRGTHAVGWIGELHPQRQRELGFSSAPLLFEIDVESAFNVNQLIFKKISKFPSVRRDLAIVVDEAVPLARVRENVNVSASGLLSELRVFDVYRGPSIELGRKSIALGLILQDSSRTLTDVDADAVVTSVVARLRDVLSATIRDQ